MYQNTNTSGLGHMLIDFSVKCKKCDGYDW